MKLINKITCGMVIIAALSGCSKSELLMYQEDPRVYFATGLAIDYTFVASPETVTKDTLYVPVRIMGSVADKDRTFNIIVDDSSTAKEGYHFEFGPKVIPAGAYRTDLPVYVYRKAGLKDSIVTAYFTIGESADFKVGYNDKARGNTQYSVLHYSISINDRLVRPATWDSRWAAYFGTYSQVKHRFINQVYGNALWPTAVSYPHDINFLVQSARFALYNYEQANGPLMDENGERVVFP